MDKKQHIQEHLQAITQEEIPDDMNLLPEIKAKLQKPTAVTRRPMFHMSRAVASFAAILLVTMVATAGYALFQLTIQDDTLPQEEVTPLDIDQTVDDITVTLEWAYADAHRATLLYTALIEDGSVLGSDKSVTLTTSDGQEIPRAYGGGGGGGGDGEVSTRSTLLNFDTTVIEGTPDQLDLILTVTFGGDQDTGMHPAVPNSGGTTGGSGGGGGGGGGGNGTPPPDAMGGGVGGGTGGVEALTDEDIPDRTYTFEFSVPFLQAVQPTVTEGEATSNGLTATVSNIRVTPSLTKFDACYQMPDTSGSPQPWMPIWMIYIGENNGPAFGSTRPIEENGQICQTFDALLPLPEDAESMTIRLDGFTRGIGEVTQELADAEMARFAEAGYTVEVDIFEGGGYGMQVTDYPDDVTQEEAISYVSSRLFREAFEGDWEFTATFE